MSPELKQFYVDMQKWIDGGCPYHDIFTARYGLCANIQFYMERNGIYERDKHNRTLPQQQEALFDAEFDGESCFPFNRNYDNSGLIGLSYFNERRDSMIFTNPQRLAWIKQHAEMEI